MATKQQKHDENIQEQESAAVHTRRTELEKDNETVRGVFRYYEVPGASFKFLFKKHAGQVEKYEFQDGEVYDIPRAVAEHLNNECWYPVHEYMHDENGKPSMRVGKRVNRVGFHSLDFMGEGGQDSHESPLVYPS